MTVCNSLSAKVNVTLRLVVAFWRDETLNRDQDVLHQRPGRSIQSRRTTSRRIFKEVPVAGYEAVEFAEREGMRPERIYLV